MWCINSIAAKISFVLLIISILILILIVAAISSFSGKQNNNNALYTFIVYGIILFILIRDIYKNDCKLTE